MPYRYYYMISVETKLRTLAAANATLQTDLGTSPFRWFDRRLVQGALTPPNPITGPVPNTTCVRVLRVSTGQDGFYNQGGQGNIEQPRIQIDVLDYDPEVARQVAADIIAFLSSVSLMSTTPTNPAQCTNFRLNQRAGMEFQLDPPAYVETLDYRIWNNQTINMALPPVVIASFDAANQSGSLSTTLLQNPPAGRYQINVYYVCTVADAEATLVGNLTYADESGANSQTIFGPEDGPGFVKGFSDFDLPFFEAESGTPIALAVTVAAQTTFRYAIHVVLLQFPAVS